LQCVGTPRLREEIDRDEMSDMNRPLVSVIIPTYNGARTIRETLDSVFAQTYSPFEVVVVDDCSKDETRSILRAYGDRIVFHPRTSNSGVCDRARCDAIERARGMYCAFIDQDDLWTPDKLEKQTAFMLAHPEVPLSHHYMRVIDEQGRPGEVRHDGRIPPTGMCARELLEHCFVTISSIMVKPQVWLRAQQAHGMRHSNTDIETFFHILREHSAGFGFIPEILGSYRRWPQSMSRQNWKWFPEDVDELERVYATRVWEGLVLKADIRQAIARACAVNAEHHRHQGRPGRALYFVRRGLPYAPFQGGLYATAAKALARGLAGQGFATG
jgi:teichuronic acid biosynthesis glycosyltransferase TuaG